MNMMTAIVPPAEALAVPSWEEWRAKVGFFLEMMHDFESAIRRLDALSPADPDYKQQSAEEDATSVAARAAEIDLYSTPAPNARALREKMEIFQKHGLGDDCDGQHMGRIIDDFVRLNPLTFDREGWEAASIEELERWEDYHAKSPAPTKGRKEEAVPPGPAAEAFMRAFFLRQSSAFKGSAFEASRPCSKAQFQFNEFAFQGALDMIVEAFIEDVHSAAIVSIVAFELIGMVIDNDYQLPDFQRNHDEMEALMKVRAALCNLWRFNDKEGGSSARPYAEHTAVADDRDRARWARDGEDA